MIRISSRNTSNQIHSNSISNKLHMACFTHHRALVMLNTCLAILAVDYHIFPRRFAKTETFGVSLMDAGVGAFVYANGVVSYMARNSIPDSNREKMKLLKSQFLQNLFNTLYSVWPIVLLGFLRLASVKAIDYQEHVSEYGVHWNFFFTLALIKVIFRLFFIIFF